ncbi:phosphodiester glycosidase family protein [Calidifontibacillus oryziterrae]|uniref:phosphodiester glycosidase family protein n=1 Tax=Calidifontibacillus oryziterrae TaxID=1191699 RepID=UPI00031D8875|nr:phosphodiester glycosidase family protein [Calidifontibacillus oryziterrae]
MKCKKINLFMIVLLFVALFNDRVGDAATANTALLDVNKGRTLVPIRFVSEQFGAKVTWDGPHQTVLIEKQDSKILLKIGDTNVTVDKVTKTIDAPPFIKDSTTYVPLRFISTVFGVEPVWNDKTATVSIEIEGKTITLNVVKYHSTQPITSKDTPITVASKSFKVGTKTINANVLTVDLNNPSVDLKVALAKDQVGKVESLADIAKRNNATIAINGTFFDAYSEELQEPYGMLIVDGNIVHLGRERTVFSFDGENNVSFAIMNPTVQGATDGSDKWPNNWYAYWINRTPQANAAANAIIFTRDRGQTVGFTHGTNVIVEDGKVKEIVSGKDVAIPQNGYVINLMGSEVHSLLSRFKVGTTVDYKIVSDGIDFSTIEGAVGAGPRLLTAGKTSIDFDLEKFTEDKIRTGSAARSAIGITQDNKLILLTTAATMHEVAEMMKQAGAYDAMNLDGGASSGLYYDGKYITTPGRDISNAILIQIK